MRIWSEPFVTLRVPKIFNLRTDPYERADITSNTYYDWLLNHAFVFVPAQAIVGQFLATFKEFPPSQKAGSFSLDDVLDKLSEGAGGKQHVTPRRSVETRGSGPAGPAPRRHHDAMRQSCHISNRLLIETETQL